MARGPAGENTVDERRGSGVGDPPGALLGAVSALMLTACSYLGRESFVDLIRDSFASALERRGYQLEVGASGLRGRHLYEYRSDATVVTLTVDDAVGAKWEAQLTVEVDAFTGEVKAIVTEAIARLLADLSTRLIKSVADESCRSSVARELSRMIATLE